MSLKHSRALRQLFEWSSRVGCLRASFHLGLSLRFVIERVGMGGVNLHDLTIRKGATISFKPYSDGNGASDDLNYLKALHSRA